MGMGCYLWVINATSKTLKVVSTQRYQMNAWEFSDVLYQTQKKFYIEYDQGPFNTDSGDDEEATFQLEGTSSSFQLQVHLPYSEGECGLKVHWNMSVELYEVFPPVLSGEMFSNLGWIHNGSLALLIVERGVITTVPTSLPGEDSIVSSVPRNLPMPSCGLWMEKYSSLLGRLTLTEMTLPGTHNSGTHRPVSQIGSVWIKCQTLGLTQQLRCGIRVLDLRIGQKSPGDYIVCHDAWHTSYSLAQALKEVTEFIDKSSKEIVILDFHRFVKLSNEHGDYDYIQLKQQISSALLGYCMPVSFADKLLREVFEDQQSPKQRVVVAWNGDNPDPYMWPGVKQRWYEDADSPSKLYQYIKSDVLGPPVAGMWASGSFMKSNLLHSPIANAARIDPTIANWYFGGSTFSEKANIISVDFFAEHSNVVQAAVIGSLLKAGRKYWRTIVFFLSVTATWISYCNLYFSSLVVGSFCLAFSKHSS